MENIDYSKLNEQIVKQAYASAHVLNEEQKRKLIQDKLARAAQYHQALKNSPVVM
jgi:hypothetical protein